MKKKQFISKLRQFRVEQFYLIMNSHRYELFWEFHRSGLYEEVVNLSSWPEKTIKKRIRVKRLLLSLLVMVIAGVTLFYFNASLQFSVIFLIFIFSVNFLPVNGASIEKERIKDFLKNITITRGQLKSVLDEKIEKYNDFLENCISLYDLIIRGQQSNPDQKLKSAVSTMSEGIHQRYFLVSKKDLEISNDRIVEIFKSHFFKPKNLENNVPVIIYGTNEKLILHRKDIALASIDKLYKQAFDPKLEEALNSIYFYYGLLGLLRKQKKFIQEMS